MLYGGGGRKGEPGNRVSPLLHWFSHLLLFPFYFAFFSTITFSLPSLFPGPPWRPRREGREGIPRSQGDKGGEGKKNLGCDGGKENARFQSPFLLRRVGRVPRGLGGTRAVRVRPGRGETPGLRVGPGPRGRGASRGGQGCPRLAEEEEEGKTAGRP